MPPGEHPTSKTPIAISLSKPNINIKKNPKNGINKNCKDKPIKMFLYSIIYLYILFLSMIIDHLNLFA